MHGPPALRPRAFRKLVTLLEPGGVLLLTLRHGPAEPDRPMWPAAAGEIEALARDHGLLVVRRLEQPDRLGRAEVAWTAWCLRLPDDGAGALPLLRGVILNDDKSSTYKLGLLRAVARIADATPALAVERGGEEDAVALPLGLVALTWVRAYLPLVTAGLPQRPRNSGPDGLGFAGPGFRALAPLGIAAQDLRLGTRAASAGPRTRDGQPSSSSPGSSSSRSSAAVRVTTRYDSLAAAFAFAITVAAAIAFW